MFYERNDQFRSDEPRFPQIEQDSFLLTIIIMKMV